MIILLGVACRRIPYLAIRSCFNLPNQSPCCFSAERSSPSLLPSLHQFEQRRHKQGAAIDRSKIPILNEEDLEEWFVKGSGPGGQNVNKRTNCCCLKHIPTGLVVKCHVSRELEQNRKMARKMLIEKLDEHLNGEDSVTAQLERIAQKRRRDLINRHAKTLELKKKYKELLDQEGPQKPSESAT